jgi:hypothetical protein
MDTATVAWRWVSTWGETDVFTVATRPAQRSMSAPATVAFAMVRFAPPAAARVLPCGVRAPVKVGAVLLASAAAAGAVA